MQRAGFMKEPEAAGSYTFSSDFVSDFTDDWRLYLSALIGRADLRMLEIGSFEGRSAIWFLEHVLTGPGCSLTCVDRFRPPYNERFDRNLAASGRSSQVVKLTGNSQDVLPSLEDASFDVVYIDGGHREREVWEDAVQGWRLTRPGGTIIFDDYAWRPELPLEDRPKRAIDRLLLRQAGAYRLMHSGYQVILQKLPAGHSRRNGS
jgi:predicted O-methyltransferase YrrM